MYSIDAIGNNFSEKCDSLPDDAHVTAFSCL
jgi:hypothetical protein